MMFSQKAFLPGILQHKGIILMLLAGRMLDFILDYYNAVFAIARETRVSLARKGFSM